MFGILYFRFPKCPPPEKTQLKNYIFLICPGYLNVGKEKDREIEERRFLFPVSVNGFLYESVL